MASAGQQMLVDAFDSQTYVPGTMGIQHMPLYDTVVRVATNTLGPANPFFVNVGAANKTIAQCNLSQSQKLAAPKTFSIMSFQLRISEDILRADMTAIQNNLCFEFFIGDLIYAQAPLWYFPAGGGVWGFSVITSDAGYQNGFPDRNNRRLLATKVVLDSQVEFYGRLNGTVVTLAAAAAGGTGATVVCLLDGLLARGAQA
jgi:hypothetical protein